MGRIVLNISRGYNTTLRTAQRGAVSGSGFRINGEGFKINGEGLYMNGNGFQINGGALASEDTVRKEIPASFRKVKLDKKEKTKNNIRLIL